MGSRVWIPQEHRRPGAAWFDIADDDGNPCGYVNRDKFEEGVVCVDCGSGAVLITDVEFSLKGAIYDFEQRHGVEVGVDLAGAYEGDEICTCLSCGNLEEGSAPFGMLKEVS